jgi:hypothetical protein
VERKRWTMRKLGRKLRDEF